MRAEAVSAFSARVFKQRQSHPPVLRANGWAGRFANRLLALLFPHFSSETYDSARAIALGIERMLDDLGDELEPLGASLPRGVAGTTTAFATGLQDLYERLWLDAEAIYDGDPAARSVDEVMSAYPGFLAIAVFRVAHDFHQLEVPVLPRLLTEYAHQRTGIDIHPGAQIGQSFCIDHGTGIVIGETTIIGDHVKIYQGVTLGALSVDKSLSASKRHPTIEDRVVIYANATILGGGTVVGHDSVIGGNVWLTGSVPPHSTVHQTADVRVRQSAARALSRSRPSRKGAPP